MRLFSDISSNININISTRFLGGKFLFILSHVLPAYFVGVSGVIIETDLEISWPATERSSVV